MFNKLYVVSLITGLFLLSMIFWTVQILLCRKVKQPIVRHIPQICAGIAVVFAFLLECDVFSRNQLRDFNETVAFAVFYMLAAPLLLGTTVAWLFHGFRGKPINYILTILAGVIGFGIYQLLGAFVLNDFRTGINLQMWGIMAAVFLLLEGVNAGVWQIMNRKRRK